MILRGATRSTLQAIYLHAVLRGKVDIMKVKSTLKENVNISSATRGKSLEDARKTRKDMPTSCAITVSCQRDPWLPTMHC
jgi:hypothetical protein